MIPFVTPSNDLDSSLCFTAAQLRAMRPKMQGDAIFRRSSDDLKNQNFKLFAQLA
jgi:hypothetical protein